MADLTSPLTQDLTGGLTAMPGEGGPGPIGTPSDNIVNENPEALAVDPAFAWMLAIPELRDIIDTGMYGGWTIDQLNTAIQESNWYKTTSPTFREFEMLQATDPAQYQQMLSQQTAKVIQDAATMGISFSPGQAQQFAQGVLAYGLTPEQEAAAMASYAQYTGLKTPVQLTGGGIGATGQGGGQIGSYMDQYLKTAADYGLPLDPQTAWQWAVDTVSLKANPQTFQAYAQSQAMSLYPQWGEQIQNGQTVAQLWAPYQQLAAKTLNVSPDQIQLLDPKYQRAISSVDPKTGQRTPMSAAQWQTTLMADPQYGYQNTPQAKNLATDTASFIGNAFGATKGQATTAIPTQAGAFG
jgi:hypothetical protein